MILRSYLFKRVTIVGVGLMGGSLGMAIKKNNLAKEVVGLSQKQSSLLKAMKQKSIDVASTNIEEAIKNSDLVILATPVESIIKLLKTINPYIRRGCIVTDLGSVKAEIVDAAQKILTHPSYFIGSHPLAGSEKRGVEYATEDLFQNAISVITPTDKSNSAAVAKINQLWTKVGSNVKVMSPDEHDEILAYVSHLPHLLAFGLIGTIPEKYLAFSAQGLKDSTRIAASSPEMWSDICLTNSKNIVKGLDEIVRQLSDLRQAIVQKNDKYLIDHFTKAKQKRETI